MAYVFAAPVKVASFTPVPGVNVPPGDPTQLTDPVAIADGVNLVDSLTGFRGYTDRNGDGEAQAGEFDVVPRSLLGKARLAQVFFDHGLISAQAPAAPDFFLVPGDDQVTVLWRPSESEATGDPFFEAAASATLADGSPNPLYDPNYRQFDVEGYRIYRARVDDPNALELIAQFDYAGTSITDYAGQVNPDPGCAPELGVTETCTVAYDPVAPGVARTVGVEHALRGEIVQVRLGDRVKIEGGQSVALKADTAFGDPLYLGDGGVPFVYVDSDVRNNFRYFYTVTAFDINSFQSGPSSFESPRIVKPVTPVPPARNYAATIERHAEIIGRGVVSTDSALPTIDAFAGTFSKPFPPARDGWRLDVVEFVGQVAADGGFSVRLDSIALGSAYDQVPVTYYATATGALGTTELAIPVRQGTQDFANGGTATFPAVPVDPVGAERYGGSAEFALTGAVEVTLPGNYYTSSFGRGCINNAPGFDLEGGCSYNGARWFSGDNETFADPTANNGPNGGPDSVPANFNNAGQLPGVITIYEARSYQTVPNIYRQVEGAFGGAARAADFEVYWGAGGIIDSVVDVTHNVLVPFRPYAAGSWGILNVINSSIPGSFDADPAMVTLADATCVAPFNEFAEVMDIFPCTAATPYVLSQTAVPGPLAFVGGPLYDDAGTPDNPADDFPFVTPAANDGFLMWLAGHWFHFELEGGAVPAEGTVWTMRSYAGGAISGGQGTGGDEGPYTYTQVGPLPFTAVGAELRIRFDVTRQLLPSAAADLAQVHTVPDPFYFRSGFDQASGDRAIKFVNLPQRAIIRIYTASGILVDIVEHDSPTLSGTATWDVRNRTGEFVASGVYFYHIESGNARRAGRFTVVNYSN